MSLEHLPPVPPALPRPAALAMLLRVALALGAGAAGLAGEHPSLLLRPADLPRIRHAAGMGEAEAARGLGKFGALREDYQALRAYAAQLPARPLPGDLLAQALMHLIEPESADDAARVRLLDRWLADPRIVAGDPLAAAIALDWCWPALGAATRRETLLRVRESPRLLRPGDSPLRYTDFQQRLAHLAIACAVDERDEPAAGWAQVREELLAAAAQFQRESMAQFIELRGAAPTSPAVAAEEESAVVVALELFARRESDRPAAFRPAARWMEHYLYESCGPALPHGFVRDFGDAAPLTPCPQFQGLQPLTAHLLAARSGDPAAVAVARRVERELRSDDPLASPWRFVPLLLDLRGLVAADAGRLPPLRNFGSAVCFRSGAAQEALAIWVETPRAHLRARQHLDAGHFLVHAGGTLLGGAAPDVAHEAVPAKGGLQRLGGTSAEFEFEQYHIATIAHNCLLLWDAGRSPTWRGRRYWPLGGQRLIESEVDAAGSGPAPARQLACGADPDAAYLALDLSGAYSEVNTRAYTREFLFLTAGVLLIVDRVEVVDAHTTPVWILNLPARPLLDNAELPPEGRTSGATNDAGVWRLRPEQRITWAERSGRAALQVLTPAAEVRAVGGPATRLPISEGTFRGRTYIGGSDNSFERLVVPAGRPNALNAWFRLGKPTRLGAQFGAIPHWGRVEVEPAQRGRRHIFIQALFIEASGQMPRGDARLVEIEEGFEVSVDRGGRNFRIHLPADGPGGTLRNELTRGARPLPGTVEPDPPLLPESAGE